MVSSFPAKETGSRGDEMGSGRGVLRMREPLRVHWRSTKPAGRSVLSTQIYANAEKMDVERYRTNFHAD